MSAPKKERKPRTPKAPKEITLAIPPKVEGIDEWIILGLDPSLSRTGYAIMHVKQGEDRSTASWVKVGSFSPEDSSVPVWIRSKLIALALRDELFKLTSNTSDILLAKTGLIISMEAPTPRNDYLTSVSRVLHVVLLEAEFPITHFGRVHVQLTNAATLRRLMGLTQKGAQNKKENIGKAFTFLDKGSFPNLDSDACDGVLMAMMARYSAAILMGYPDSVPEQFRIALCDATQEIKGKGRNQRTQTKGIFYRPEYWTRYERKEYAVQLRDARVKTTRVPRHQITI